MKRSKNWGVQKAGSAPKAQAQSGQQQKTQSTQKKTYAARKTRRIVGAKDLGRQIKIKRPQAYRPKQCSGAALYQAKHAPDSSTPSDLI
jgi:hypothetical protein